MVLLDVSSNNFSQKRNFDLIFFKHLSREISSSNFVYLFAGSHHEYFIKEKIFMPHFNS